MGGELSTVQDKSVYRAPEENPGHLAFKAYANETFSLYDAVAVEPPKRVAIMGFVQDDGSGDYFIMLQLAERVHQLYQNAAITIYAQVHSLRSKERFFPTDDRFEYFFSGAARKLHKSFEDEDPDLDGKLRMHAERAVKRADLIIEAPHMSQTTRLYHKLAQPPVRILELCTNLIQRKDLRIHEKEAHNVYCMGLGDSEFGLNFVSSGEKKRSLEDLEYAPLRVQLLKNPKVPLYFNYFSPKSTMRYRRFLHERLGNADTDIVIVSITKSGVMSEYSDMNGTPSIAVHIPDHIQTIETFRTDDSNQLVPGETIPGAEKGICVRVFEISHLPHEDILTLLALAQEPTSCTGNMSLLETLSFDKLPDYDHFKLIQLGILTGFLHRIETYFDDKEGGYELRTYFINLFEQRVQSSALLKNPLLYSQWRDFLTHLKEEHNFNHILPRILHKTLVMQQLSPAFMKEERKLVRQVKAQELDPSEAAGMCGRLFTKHLARK